MGAYQQEKIMSVGKVTESTVTFKALYDKMQEAVENGEQITITIK